MLFDTTFFIDLEHEMDRRRPGSCASFLQTHRHRTKHVSVITIGEFAVVQTASATVKFFRGYRPIALGRNTAIFGGRLQAHLTFALSNNDLWIAATAMRLGHPLVTRDRVFSRIPGLTVLSY